MPRRKLTDAERLSRSIANIIRRSKCSPSDVVESLIAVAAGRAALSQTHDCVEFEDHAREAFHSALSVLADRRQKGDRLVN